MSVQSASTAPVVFEVPLTNEASGTVEVDGGELISEATTTNEGPLALPDTTLNPARVTTNRNGSARSTLTAPSGSGVLVQATTDHGSIDQDLNVDS